MSDPPASPTLLIACGEPSGDLYAAELLRELRRARPGIQAFGLGGDRLAEAGAGLSAHIRDMAVVGLLEVVRHLRRLRGIFDRLLDEVERRRPRLAVLIDYPDFNLRLARALRRRGVPVVYYVSPQLWAWRRGRIRTVRETAERMLVIFPFEESLYREAGVPVRFVGHPLVELVVPCEDRAACAQDLCLDPTRPVLALLPGSRPGEVGHNLPGLLAAADLLLAERPELQPVLAAAPSLDLAQLREQVGPRLLPVVPGRTRDVVGAARLALVASGTATVETALLGTPMVVVYRLSALTYALGRPLVRVPHYAMVNLIAERRLVPELIQGGFTPGRVAAEARALLDDGPAREAQLTGLAEVRRRLGDPGASRRAAESVLEALDAG
jgi:lipid-A-disaccharide synthase